MSTRIAATAPRLKTLRVTEKDVARAVKDFMAAKGFRCVRMQRTVLPGQFQSGEPGMPDLLFLRYRDGAIVWVETKAPGRTLSPAQAQWRDMERMRWPDALVWTIHDPAEIIGYFAGTEW